MSKEKEDRESRARLLENTDFHRFLKYLCSNAAEVLGMPHLPVRKWLPDWLITGCELYFTDIDGKIKKIIKQ